MPILRISFRIGGIYKYAEYDEGHILYSCVLRKQETYMWTEFVPPTEFLLQGSYSVEIADGWTPIRILGCVGSIATSEGTWIPVYETNRPDALALCKTIQVYQGGGAHRSKEKTESVCVAVLEAPVAAPPKPQKVQFSQSSLASASASASAADASAAAVRLFSKSASVLCTVSDAAADAEDTTEAKLARFRKLYGSTPAAAKLLTSLESKEYRRPF